MYKIPLLYKSSMHEIPTADHVEVDRSAHTSSREERGKNFKINGYSLLASWQHEFQVMIMALTVLRKE